MELFWICFAFAVGWLIAQDNRDEDGQDIHPRGNDDEHTDDNFARYDPNEYRVKGEGVTDFYWELKGGSEGKDFMPESVSDIGESNDEEPGYDSGPGNGSGRTFGILSVSSHNNIEKDAMTLYEAIGAIDNFAQPPSASSQIKVAWSLINKMAIKEPIAKYLNRAITTHIYFDGEGEVSAVTTGRGLTYKPHNATSRIVLHTTFHGYPKVYQASGHSEDEDAIFHAVASSIGGNDGSADNFGSHAEKEDDAEQHEEWVNMRGGSRGDEMEGEEMSAPPRPRAQRLPQVQSSFQQPTYIQEGDVPRLRSAFSSASPGDFSGNSPDNPILIPDEDDDESHDTEQNNHAPSPMPSGPSTSSTAGAHIFSRYIGFGQPLNNPFLPFLGITKNGFFYNQRQFDQHALNAPDQDFEGYVLRTQHLAWPCPLTGLVPPIKRDEGREVYYSLWESLWYVENWESYEQRQEVQMRSIPTSEYMNGSLSQRIFDFTSRSRATGRPIHQYRSPQPIPQHYSKGNKPPGSRRTAILSPKVSVKAWWSSLRSSGTRKKSVVGP